MAQAPEFNAAQMAQLDAVLAGNAEFDQEQIMRLQGQPAAPAVAPQQQQPRQPQAAFVLPKEVVDAYNSGAMDQASETELEADVASGEVSLPEGVQLARKVSPRVAQAYASGALSPEQVAELEAAISSGLARLPAGTSKPAAPATVSLDQAASAAPSQGLQASLATSPQGPAGTSDKKEELGVVGTIKDTFTGESRKTVESEALPDWAGMPELNSFSLDSLKTAFGTMVTDPSETAQIIQSNYPNVKARQDVAGNIILKSSLDGNEYVIKPGFRISDIPRAAAGVLAYAPAGRALTIGKAAASSAATGATIEASQAAMGGTFDVGTVALDALTGGAAIPASKLAGDAANRMRKLFGAKQNDIYIPPKSSEGTPERVTEDLFEAVADATVKPDVNRIRKLAVAMGRLDPAGIKVPEYIAKKYNIDMWSEMPVEAMITDPTVARIMNDFASNSQYIAARRTQFAGKASEVVDRNIKAVATDEPVTNPVVEKETGARDRGAAQDVFVERLQEQNKKDFGRKTGEGRDRVFVKGRTHKAYDEVYDSMEDPGATSVIPRVRAAIEAMGLLRSGELDKKGYSRILGEMPDVAYWIQQAEFAEKGLDAAGHARKKGVEFIPPEPITAEKLQQTIRSSIDAAIDRSDNGEIIAGLEKAKTAAMADLQDLIEEQGGDVDALSRANEIYRVAAEDNAFAKKTIGEALVRDTAVPKEAMGAIDRAVKGLEKGKTGNFVQLMKNLGPDSRTILASSLETIFTRSATTGQRDMRKVYDFFEKVSRNRGASEALREHLTPEYAALFEGSKKLFDMAAKMQAPTNADGATYNVMGKVVDARSFNTKVTLATRVALTNLSILLAQKTGGFIGGKTGSGVGAIVGSAAARTAKDTGVSDQSVAQASAVLGEILKSPEFIGAIKELAAAQSVTKASAERAIKAGKAPGLTREQLIKKWEDESLGKIGRIKRDMAKLPAMKELARVAGVDLKKVGGYEDFLMDFYRAAFSAEDLGETSE